MKRKARTISAGLSALLMAGCWYAPGQGPDRAGYNPFESTITVETVGELELKWTATTDDPGVGDPVVSNHAVHVAAANAYYGFSPASGARAWKHTRSIPGVPDGSLSIGAPVSDGGRLLVGAGVLNFGGAYTSEWLDAATGEPLGITTGAGLADSSRGSMVAFRHLGVRTDMPTETRLALVDFDDPEAGWTGLVDLDLNLTGAGPFTLGTSRAYGAGEGLVSLANPASPAFGHGLRAFTVADPPICHPYGNLPCPTWMLPLDGTDSTVPVLGPDESVVYTGTDAGTVYAVDAASGAVLWTASVGAAVTASPALADGVLYVPAGGRLVAFDAGGCGAATCGPLWEAAPMGAGAVIREQPAVAGGLVFAGGSDGSVAAFDAAGCGSASCAPLWSVATGSEITGAPAVTNGQLYVGTSDGRLLAYGLA